MGVRSKNPAQMCFTIGTYTNLPGISSKPGEFRRNHGCRNTPPCLIKTADFKHMTMGIGKGMQKSPVHFYAFIRNCHLVTAIAAKDNWRRSCCDVRCCPGCGIRCLSADDIHIIISISACFHIFFWMWYKVAPTGAKESITMLTQGIRNSRPNPT